MNNRQKLEEEILCGLNLESKGRMTIKTEATLNNDLLNALDTAIYFAKTKYKKDNDEIAGMVYSKLADLYNTARIAYEKRDKTLKEK